MKNVTEEILTEILFSKAHILWDAFMKEYSILENDNGSPSTHFLVQDGKQIWVFENKNQAMHLIRGIILGFDLARSRPDAFAEWERIYDMSEGV